jgi:hypothetical protein
MQIVGQFARIVAAHLAISAIATGVVLSVWSRAGGDFGSAYSQSGFPGIRARSVAQLYVNGGVSHVASASGGVSGGIPRSIIGRLQ